MEPTSSLGPSLELKRLSVLALVGRFSVDTTVLVGVSIWLTELSTLLVPSHRKPT
jgi:hypothetical protein